MQEDRERGDIWWVWGVRAGAPGETLAKIGSRALRGVRAVDRRAEK